MTGRAPRGSDPAGREITDAEMLAALLPDSVGDLASSVADMRPRVADPSQGVALPGQVIPDMQLSVAYRLGPDGTLVPVYVPSATLAMRAVAPTATAGATASQPVPSWAKGVAVVSVGVGAGGWLLAGAFDLVSSAVAGIAAGAAAALPLLILAGVAVAALAGRRGSGKAEGVNVSQTVTQSWTQTISNNVRVGE